MKYSLVTLLMIILPLLALADDHTVEGYRVMRGDGEKREKKTHKT